MIHMKMLSLLPTVLFAHANIKMLDIFTGFFFFYLHLLPLFLKKNVLLGVHFFFLPAAYADNALLPF